MSTLNFVEELEYNDAKGLDTTSPSSMLAPGYVRVARNSNIGTTGGYTKRDGYTTQLSTKWAGSVTDVSIRQGVEYRKSNGTSLNLFFGSDGGADGRFGKEDAGGISDILTGLAPNNRMDFVQFEDRLFAFNGDSVGTPFVYEGAASTRNLGIAAPIVDPVPTATTGGSLGTGSYVYVTTYVNIDAVSGQLLAESSPSATASVSVTGVNNAVDLDVTASGNSSVTNIRVYRTFLSGAILFLESTIANATATHNSIAADSSLLATQSPLDNSQLDDFNGYDKSKFPVVARNRLFVAHSERNEVRWSKIGQESALPESFPAVNFQSVEGKFGSADPVIGMGQIKGIPIVLKKRSIGRLEEIGLPEITRAEDPTTYIYREISDTVGGIANGAHIQVFDELLFLGVDNIYATNGASVRPIANDIQASIKNFDFRDIKNFKMSVVNDTKNRRVYFAVFNLLIDLEPNFILVGDYQQYPNFRWTFYTEGTNAVTHPGIRPGSLFQLTNSLDGTLDAYFGNADNDGQYYRLNDGTNDNGNGIFFKIVSRPYAFGQPLVIKLYKNARIFIEAADDTYQIEFCSIYDLSIEEEFCANFTIPAVGNKWDEHNWVDDAETEADPLIWAGPNLAELNYNLHRKAKFMQLVLNQTEADAPVTLLGWGVSGSIFGGI